MLGKKNADTKMSTLIGAGAELTGDFTLDGSARIDGKIGGNVTVTGNLILGAGSIVTGDVQAASVLIGGEVTGNITAPEKAVRAGRKSAKAAIAEALKEVEEEEKRENQKTSQTAETVEKTETPAAETTAANTSEA